jgi:hypothetical protein
LAEYAIGGRGILWFSATAGARLRRLQADRDQMRDEVGPLTVRLPG